MRTGVNFGAGQFWLLDRAGRTKMGCDTTRTCLGSLRPGPKQWEQVVASGGDYSVIGFPLNTNPPVEDFDKYMAACLVR